MKNLLAILFPCVVFFLRGKIMEGFLCLVLQLVLIGWLPASIWASSEILLEREMAKFQKQRDELKF